MEGGMDGGRDGWMDGGGMDGDRKEKSGAKSRPDL